MEGETVQGEMDLTPQSSSLEKLTIEDARYGSSSWESFEEADGPVDPGQLVWGNNVIVSKIFSYLKPSELKTCRYVSPHWNKIALSRAHLGSKTLVKIGPSNIDDFLQLVRKSDQAFCRKFDFSEIEWDFNRVAAFKKLFKHAVSSLSLSYCKAMKAHSIMKLLMCPNMQELKITGDLFRSVVDVDNLFMRHEKLERLMRLELTSSQEFGQVSLPVIQKILTHSPQLRTVFIKRSLSLWKNFVTAAISASESGFRAIELSEMENRLDYDMFEELRPKLQELQSCKFENCIVGPEFLEIFLLMFKNTLSELAISGTQDEILTRGLQELQLSRMVSLTLPVDGIGSHDGQLIVQSMPNLKTFEVVGLFRTKFELSGGELLSITTEEFEPAGGLRITDSPQANAVMSEEKSNEFSRIVLLLPLKCKRFKSTLLRFNSRCFRNIYRNYKELEELVILNCSKDCADAWTGISQPVCKKIANRRTFAVVNLEKVQFFPSLGVLKNLKQLEISIIGEALKAEATLVLAMFGICQLKRLEVLRLSNITTSDVMFLAMSKTLNLTACYVDGSSQLWTEFLELSQNFKIRSFLLPPGFCEDKDDSSRTPLQERIILHKIFSYLKPSEIFPLRLVSKMWHTTVTERLHSLCTSSVPCEVTAANELKYTTSMRHASPQGELDHTSQPLVNQQLSDLSSVLTVLHKNPSITKLIIRTMNKPMLDWADRIYHGVSKQRNCREFRRMYYWYFPQGAGVFKRSRRKCGPPPTTLVVLGCWTKKDSGLLEFLNPSFNFKSVEFVGLMSEVYDVLLPKLTTMSQIESICIKPFNANCTSEIARHHLQILSSASFSLRNLSLQKLQAPPDAVSELIRRHRFTLETLELQNFVNVSDKLSFSIPNLRILQLDEPPGVCLWRTLNVNQTIETIRVERSGYNFKQGKSNAIPSCDSTEDEEFEHSATEIICDVNLFLEYMTSKPPGFQKSALQAGTDSVLKFVGHFRFLTSLTIRGVHAHYGILQGIFRNLPHLEKLILASFAGCTDEILTGIPKDSLEKMDLLNPLQLKTSHESLKLETSRPSLRNMKNLTHLDLDDQLHCTDLSILFGVIKLKKLKHFSCRKWKVTDVGIRLLTDFLDLETLILHYSSPFSSFGVKYFSNKTLGRCIVDKQNGKSIGLSSSLSSS